MQKYTIIGIDGGATKASAWEILYDKSTKSFTQGKNHSEKKYSSIPASIVDFKPIDIKIQLAEREEGSISPTIDEQQQASVFVEACATAIEEIVEATENKNILIGLGMPGLKTADKRGIAVMANGPRMINFCDLLEARLKAVEIQLVVPVNQLGSDADYCGIGENFCTNGAFVDIENGYYLGGGTGVADALKLNNQLIPFDAVKDWMAKTWELKSSVGKSLEKYCSAAGIQSIYAELSGVKLSELNQNEIYPPQIIKKAMDGENAAIETFNHVTTQLAELICSRITTLALGWQTDFEFVTPLRSKLSNKHEYLGLTLDKIILGQRLGDLYDSREAESILKIPLVAKLKTLIDENKLLSSDIKNHYAQLEKIIMVSQLREAPALGAGIDAFHNMQKVQK